MNLRLVVSDKKLFMFPYIRLFKSCDLGDRTIFDPGA